MQRRTRVATAATLTAVAATAVGAVGLLRDGPPEPDFSDPMQYLQDGVFVAYLVAASWAVLEGWRAGLAPRMAGRLVALGYGLIAVGVLAGMALRDDPDWFVALGLPGNLLAAVGFVVWAVWAVRTQTLPVPLALLAGVGGFVAVLGAEFGTTLLVAAFFARVAVLARRRDHGDGPAASANWAIERSAGETRPSRHFTSSG